MNIIVKTVLLTLFIVIMSGAGNLGYTVGSPPPIPIKATLEPVLPMVKGSPISLQLSYNLVDSISGCKTSENGSYSLIFINPKDYSDTISRADYQVTYGKSFSHSEIIQVELPMADTCWLHVVAKIGSCSMKYSYYFITFGDEVEFRPGYLIPEPKQYQSWTWDKNKSQRDPIRDTLTQEHLQTEYEIIIDLRDSSHFQIAKDILKSIPDSCIYNKRRGLYKITTTLENLIKLGDHNLECEFTTPPPWDKTHNAPSNSTPEKQTEYDSNKTQDSPPPTNHLYTHLPGAALH